MVEPLALHEYAPGGLEAAREFLKRTRWELRELWRVRVWADRVQVFDVNKDFFEGRGIGYPDPSVADVLHPINTAFDPATLHEATKAEYKEYGTGRRFPWAHDRVL